MITHIISKLQADQSDEIAIEFTTIQDEEAKQLSPLIANSRSLKKFRLSCNTITDAGFKFLAQGLINNGSINYLEILGMAFTPDVIAEIAYLIVQMPSLKFFRLNANQLPKENSSNILPIANALKINNTLLSFDFYDYPLDFEEINALAQAISEHPTLTSVSFVKIGTTSKGVTALANALKTNKRLEKFELNYEYGYLDQGGVEALAEALTVNKSLIDLNLVENRLKGSFVRKLADALKVNQSLKKLDLRGNELGVEGAGYLAESLRANKNLTTLILTASQLDAASMQQLAVGLRANQGLKVLIMRANDFGREGLNALLPALIGHPTLTEVDLSANQLMADSAPLISDWLAHNRVLLSLTLEVNQLDPKALTEGLRANSTLEILNLNNNRITDEGITALAYVLPEQRSLQRLDINYNSFTQSGVAVLAQALIQNKILQTLNWKKNNCFEKNEIEAKISQMIDDSLARNQELQKQIMQNAYEILRYARILFREGISSNNNGININDIPEDLKMVILNYLQVDLILTPTQLRSIIHYAQDKTTLGTSREDFLKNTACNRYQFFSPVSTGHSPSVKETVNDESLSGDIGRASKKAKFDSNF